MPACPVLSGHYPPSVPPYCTFDIPSLGEEAQTDTLAPVENSQGRSEGK